MVTKEFFCGNGSLEELRSFLDAKVEQYNQPDFITDDPVCIPHLFTRKQDIEIMGLWAAVLAWGQRKTIIAKCRQLISLMDGAPYDFITGHREADLKPFLEFKHRTFNATDTLYFIEFFRQHYSRHDSLEEAFTKPVTGTGPVLGTRPVLGTADPANGSSKNISVHANGSNPGGLARQLLPEGPGKVKRRAARQSGLPEPAEPVETCLNNFSRRFFSLPDFPRRTMKHIPSPERDSACKRLNMFLRWMVRSDGSGIDFGLWKNIRSSALICPCDVHVERAARKLGLIRRPRGGWQTALELTGNLRRLDPADPVKYDFALFGMGVTGEL